jgi:hypothetical protein
MTLSIRTLTLYKHGLAHIERAGTVEGERLELRFPTEAMDDVLKSLVVVDQSGGVVHGVDVERAEDRHQRLSEEPLQLSPSSSLLDLLRDLRGHHVVVKRIEGGEVAGTVVGIDVEDEDSLKRPLVSILTNGSPGAVVPIAVSSIDDVQLTADADADVRRVLQTWRGQDRTRSATVRLSAGTHELRVAHLTPAPTWRVSYRIVIEEAKDTMLLQAWGLFDNTFDEDLDGVAVTLVAGMPVSFRYRLYEGHIPTRPEVRDESRTMASAVEFEPMAEVAGTMMAAAPAPMMKASRGGASRSRYQDAEVSHDQISASDMERGFAGATGESRGSLFAYVVPEPVSAGRGRSVLVPLISQQVAGKRELLYKAGSANNGNPPCPIASLRLANTTGLTLERGPVTVLEHGGYGGEAIVAFSPPDASFVVPYAVELGIKVRETRSNEASVNTLRVKDRYLLVEETVVITSSYIITNSLATTSTVTVEHPLSDGWELVDTVPARETGGGSGRWDVACEPRLETVLVLKEQRLHHRYENVSELDGDRLHTYLLNRRLNEALHNGLVDVLALYQSLEVNAQTRSDLDGERDTLNERQGEARQNLEALGTAGDEGRLRKRFVSMISDSQDRLDEIDRTDAVLLAEYQSIQGRINVALDELANQ